MYEDYFGLTRVPFSTSPDPEFIVMTPHTREALAGLEYGIRYRKGIMVLSGEVGTGKSLLLRAALEKFSKSKVHFAYVFNPRLDILDFLEFMLVDFGLQPSARTKAAMLQQLNQWLLEQYRRKEICVLLVDEAQDCSLELLEEIRLLTNLETSSEKLIQVVLAGQPELKAKLRLDQVRQLRQRVAVWCSTYPLSYEETATYIVDRLRIAGTEEHLFTEGAVRRIFELSGGLPRIVNVICEHTLIVAYVHQEKQIVVGMVEAVSNDLILESPAESIARIPGHVPPPVKA